MPVEQKSLVTVQCDNPRCKKVHFFVENRPEEIPDEVFRLLIVQRFGEQTKFVFCSKHCTLDWFNNEFVPMKSPRELAAEQAVAQVAAPPTAPVVDAVPPSTPATEQAVLAPSAEAVEAAPEPAPKVVAIDRVRPRGRVRAEAVPTLPDTETPKEPVA